MYDIYVVKENDTIDNIVSKYGTDSTTIIKLNGNITTLTPGMSIVVPKKKENDIFTSYTIKKGDTLYKIAEEYKINPNLLAQLNGLNKNDYIYPNQQILVPKSNVRVYITAEGDTLEGIIKGMKADTSKFLSQNTKIYLYPGQLVVYMEK